MLNVNGMDDIFVLKKVEGWEWKLKGGYESWNDGFESWLNVGMIELNTKNVGDF